MGTWKLIRVTDEQYTAIVRIGRVLHADNDADALRRILVDYCEIKGLPPFPMPKLGRFTMKGDKRNE